MKRFILLFAKGMGLGLGVGLCLAGVVALVYRAVHSGEAVPVPGRTLAYFFIVGGFMGLVGGWCLALQMVLGGLLSTLFMKISELVPMEASAVTEDWAVKMETFFREVLAPLPGFFRKLVDALLVVRFRDYGRINRAMDKAKRKEPGKNYSPQWMAQVVLHFFLEPLWLFFYAAYVILFLLSCIFWGFAFIK